MSRMSRTLHQLLSFVAIIVVIVAVLVSLARFFTPLLNQHKASFQHWATHIIGAPVKIAQVHASFQGFEATFVFDDVNVSSPDLHQPLFHLHQLALSVDLWHSLLQRRLITGTIIIDGAKLDLRQQKNGQWRINDQKIGQPADKSSVDTSKSHDLLSAETTKVLDWILAQRRIILRNIALTYHRQKQANIIFPDIDIKLFNRGHEHRLRGSTQLESQQQSRLQLEADFFGSIAQLSKMHGEIYAGAKNIDFASGLPWGRLSGMNIQHGTGGVQLWTRFADGDFYDVQSVLVLRNAKLGSSMQNLTIDHLHGNFLWQRLAHHTGWKLIGNKVNIETNNHQWPRTDFAIQMEQPNTPQAKQIIHLRHLNIGDLSTLISQNQWLPLTLRQKLQILKPQGMINFLDIVHNGSVTDLLSHSKTHIADSVRFQWLPLAANNLLQIHSCQAQQVSIPRRDAQSCQRNLASVNHSGLMHGIPYLINRRSSQVGLTSVAKNHSFKDDEFLLPNDLFAQLSVSHFSNQTDGKLPSVKNMTGDIYWRPHHIQLHVNSRYGALLLPQLLSNTLPFSTLSAQAKINYDADHWQIQLSQLALNNQYLTLNGQFLLDKKNHQSPLLNAALQVKQRGNQYIRQLLPTKIMSPALMHWLTHAFVAGKSLDGLVVYRGRLSDYPFAKQQGVFMADASIHQMQLHFADGWPDIKHFDADLLFHNRQMQVKLLSGQIFGTKIHSVTADIPRLSGKDASDLSVKAGLSLDSGKALDFIQHSPLKKNLSGLQVLSMHGATHIALDLIIPLTHEDREVSVDGNADLRDNQLTVPERNLQMQHLNGRLHFTEKGIFSKKLTSHFFQQSARMTIDTKTLANKQHVVQLDLDSQISMPTLFAHFDWQKNNRITGKMHYHATYRIPNTGHSQLSIRSNLQGVTIDAVPPYAKKAQQKTDFHTLAEFDDKQTFLKMAYDQKINAAMILKNDNQHANLQSAEIALGGRIANYQKQPGVLISGYIPRLDFTTWQQYAQKTSTNNQAKRTDNLIKQLRQIKVVIGRLDAFDQTLYDPQLSITHPASNWKIAIDSSKIIGQIILPDAYPKQAIRAHFSRLYLGNIAKTDNILSSNKQQVGLHANDTPPLQLTADDFHYGKRQFGQLVLTLKPIQKGVDIQQLTLKSSLVDLSMTGQWFEDKQKNFTDIHGHVNAMNLGQALKNWQLSDKLVRGNGQIDFSLAWPASPYDVGAKGLQGQVSLNLSNGSITQLGSSTDTKLGLGKLINVLSIQSIFRRLTLNFDDLKNGYPYDKLTADANIHNGVITTRNMRIRGSVASMNISGNLDLLSRQCDLILHIAPHLTSSIPVVATIFGGPIVGAATWVADKLVSPMIDNTASSTLAISGPIDNPQVETLKQTIHQAQQQNDQTLKALNQLSLVDHLQP